MYDAVKRILKWDTIKGDNSHLDVHWLLLVLSKLEFEHVYGGLVPLNGLLHLTVLLVQKVGACVMFIPQ